MAPLIKQDSDNVNTGNLQVVITVRMRTEESREAACRLQGDGAIGVSHLKNPGIDGRKSYIRLLQVEPEFSRTLVNNDSAQFTTDYINKKKKNKQELDTHDQGVGKKFTTNNSNQDQEGATVALVGDIGLG